MKSQKLKFSFKGDRNYVHGTDIFNECTSYFKKNLDLSESMSFKMKIKNIIKSECVLHVLSSTEKLPIDIDPCVEIVLNNKEKTIHCFIEEANIPIIDSYNFDENKILKSSKIEGNKIYLKDKNEFSDIENIFIMNKIILSENLPKINKNWFFAMLEIYDLKSFYNSKNLIIEYNQLLAGKYAKSSIFDNNRLKGNIYFSLV